MTTQAIKPLPKHLNLKPYIDKLTGQYKIGKK